LVCW